MDYDNVHLLNSIIIRVLLLLFIVCFLNSNAVLLVQDEHFHGLKGSKPKGCDLFRGSWRYDSTYNPLYNASICSFIEKPFDCQRNGRPDQLYLKYKWEPFGCELPKFDGVKFLRKYEGKKIMFIGDSLSLNQWQSLTCMLHAAVPTENFTITTTGNISTFSFPDHKVSLMLSRNAFLVDLVETKMGRILKLDSIKNGDAWKGFDMLIFNTWHWWLHKGRMKSWDYIQDGKKFYKDMDRLVAFEKGLKTWSKWVHSNVDPSHTRVFFQGISPTHYNGVEWNDSTGTSCMGETRPINNNYKYPGGGSMAAAATVVKEVVANMSNSMAVTFLDVTTLSQLRKDGHPSIYGSGGGIGKGNDCSHWCLAGVPDTWNQLLYAILVKDHISTSKVG